MHLTTSDTWTLGISWLNKEIYGEGGLQLHIGKRIVCFWDEENNCSYCLGEGEHWPLDETTWRCPRCDAEYYE